MSDSTSDRDAVISAANVLMVALLKLNRILIPAVLKWRRSRRLLWIQRAERDLQRREEREARQEARRKRRRRQDRLRRANSAPPRRASTAGKDPTKPATKPSQPTQEEKETGQPNPQQVSSGNFSSLSEIDQEMAAAMKQREKVRREQDIRAEKMDVFVYTSVMTVFITVVSVILYSTIIIAVVLTQFPFTKSQAMVFAFSLVATAIVSEAELLMRGKGKKDSNGRRKDPANFRVKPGATGASMGGDAVSAAENGYGGGLHQTPSRTDLAGNEVATEPYEGSGDQHPAREGGGHMQTGNGGQGGGQNGVGMATQQSRGGIPVAQEHDSDSLDFFSDMD